MRAILLILTAASFLAPGAMARQVQSVGTESTFDVATWNIEWFGSSNGPSDDARQLTNVQTIIESSDIDLWALQEIADLEDFASLLSNLGPDWAGNTATASSQQRVGFLYRTDVVQPRQVGHILTDFSDAFATRPPWLMEATITLPDTSFVMTLVTLHMKAFSDMDSYNRRVEASKRMKSRFDFFESSTNLVVLGDWNDELNASITSGQPSPYENFLADATHYRFVTKPLEDAGTCTYCGSSLTSTIDHIMVSDELFAAADAGLMDRHSSVITGIPGFLSTTSDHVPAFLRLLPSATNTSTERPGTTVRHVGVHAWPNPASHTLHVDAPEESRFQMVDLLGRLVRSGFIRGGRIDLTGLPSGVYAVRIDANPSVLVTVHP